MDDHIPPAQKIQTLEAPILVEDDEELVEDASFWVAASTSPLHDDHGSSFFSEEADAEAPSGFSKYKAQILPREEIPDRKARITYAKDASHVGLEFPDRRQYRAGRRRGGGIRRKIKNLTKRARREFRLFTAKIGRNAKALHICLTYPAGYPEDPSLWKAHMERFLKRLDRRYGKHAVIWRLEFQQRGAPHFHLVYFLDGFLPFSNAALSEFREFSASAWYEACGTMSGEHLKAGTTVERVRSLVDILKYVTKAETLQRGPEGSAEEGLEAGRRWGAWNRKLLPIDLEELEIGEKDAFKVRRFLRRLRRKKARGTVRSLFEFVGDSVVRRILEFLGFSP